MKNLRSIARCSVLSVAVALLLLGCDSSTGAKGGKTDGSDGGQASSGGTGGTSVAPTTGSGGSIGSDGNVGTGGAGSGGSRAAGGSATGGTSGTGGKIGSGGNSGSGGVAAGGMNGSGGSSSSGGATRTGSGGSSGGDTGAGGSGPRGGATGAGGGTGQGGTTGAGGTTATGSCTVTDWGTPPSGDSAWIDESWNSQLSNNVKTRKEWLLDSAIAGKGQINVCVRWGATAAPSADLKTNIGSWVEKWFNDWFKTLSGYGCFPYSRIPAKVTGWAVRKGSESWVSDLDSSTIKVYTDVESGSDPPDEPQCAQACSFFTPDGKGTHSFPNCPGGEAFHFDYSMWLDDKLPGSGAAAVGGDWGLRMPAGDFISLKGSPSSVVEHEMGHGFGFQDYYDWTQDKPADGSLMVVGSSNSQTPTQGDIWLLRRTWKEMKALRGW
jgi:hypothetical protein